MVDLAVGAAPTDGRAAARDARGAGASPRTLAFRQVPG